MAEIVVTYALSTTGQKEAMRRGIAPALLQKHRIDGQPDAALIDLLDEIGADGSATLRIGEPYAIYLDKGRLGEGETDNREPNLIEVSGDQKHPEGEDLEQLASDELTFDAPYDVAALIEAERTFRERRSQNQAIANERLEACQTEFEQKRQQADADRTEMIAEAEAWIAQRGSNRLKRILEEGLLAASLRAYRDERLEKERSGWRWQSDVVGETYPIANPTDKDFTFLDKARRSEPSAKLVNWRNEQVHNDEGYLAQDPYDGPATVAKFLGQAIVRFP